MLKKRYVHIGITLAFTISTLLSSFANPITTKAAALNTTVTVDASTDLGAMPRLHNNFEARDAHTRVGTADEQLADAINFDIHRTWSEWNTELYNFSTSTYDYAAQYALYDKASRISDSILWIMHNAYGNVTNGTKTESEYRTIMYNVLKHYKERYPKIEWIEVGNEPHNIDDNYYNGYKVTYSVINQINNEVNNGPKLKIGGPVTAGPDMTKIGQLLDYYVADANSDKKLDFISYHNYLFGNEKKPSIISSERNDVNNLLSTRGLSTNIPILVSETGVFPGSNGTKDYTTDILTQAAGVASNHYYYLPQTNIKPFHWVHDHSTNSRKNQFAPNQDGVPTPYYNMIRMLSMLKGNRISASSNQLTSNGIGVYGLASKDNNGVYIMNWNYQWTDVNKAEHYASRNWPDDISIQVKVRPISLTTKSQVGIALARDYYFVYNHKTGKLEIQYWSGEMMRTGATPTVLASKTYSLNTNTTYTFKAVRNGSNLLFLVNQVEELTATHTATTTGLISSLVSDFAHTAFDDILAIKLADGSTLLSNAMDTTSAFITNQGNWSIQSINSSNMLVQTKLPDTANVQVQTNNLPSIFNGKSIKVERYLIDNTHSNYKYDVNKAALEKVEDVVLPNASSVNRSFSLQENALSLLVLTPVTPDAISAYNQIEGEAYSTQSGLSTGVCDDIGGGTAITNAVNGEYAVYNNVDFGQGASSLNVRLSSGSSIAGGTIEFHLDSLNGPIISTIDAANSGGWSSWVTRSSTTTGATGIHNLYMIFKKPTEGSGVANVNWFTFAPVVSQKIEAESYQSQVGLTTGTCSDGTGAITIKTADNGDYAVYNNVNFGSGYSRMDVRLANGSSANGASIEFRLGSTTGTLIGTVNSDSTGGWDTWETRSITLNGAQGVHNLYMVFKKTTSGGAGNVNWFQINP